MTIHGRWRDWAHGWRDLAHHDDVGDYRELCWRQRLAGELAVVRDAAHSASAWGTLLVGIALALAAQILAWELDLRGWQRDGLLCLPVLLVAPWVGAGRRRRLERHLAHRAAKPLNRVTDRLRLPIQSDAGNTRGRGRWLTTPITGRGSVNDRASAGSTSCWRSRASALWRRWRCRGNRS
jgi:hypothetical protein